MLVNETEIRVIFGDTDAMGIVYHANYIDWFEKGRTEWLREAGYPYKRMDEEGIWLPVSRVECIYKTPAHYDDLLVIRTWLKELKAATAVMGYEIYKKETGETCVEGTTVHPITDPDIKPIRFKKVNPELHAIMKANEAPAGVTPQR